MRSTTLELPSHERNACELTATLKAADGMTLASGSLAVGVDGSTVSLTFVNGTTVVYRPRSVSTHWNPTHVLFEDVLDNGARALHEAADVDSAAALGCESDLHAEVAPVLGLLHGSEFSDPPSEVVFLVHVGLADLAAVLRRGDNAECRQQRAMGADVLR